MFGSKHTQMVLLGLAHVSICISNIIQLLLNYILTFIKKLSKQENVFYKIIIIYILIHKNK